MIWSFLFCTVKWNSIYTLSSTLYKLFCKPRHRNGSSLSARLQFESDLKIEKSILWEKHIDVLCEAQQQVGTEQSSRKVCCGVLNRQIRSLHVIAICHFCPLILLFAWIDSINLSISCHLLFKIQKSPHDLQLSWNFIYRSLFIVIPVESISRCF